MKAEGFPHVLRTITNMYDFLLESGPPNVQLVFGALLCMQSLFMYKIIDVNLL